DSKSGVREGVWVRVPPRPLRLSPARDLQVPPPSPRAGKEEEHVAASRPRTRRTGTDREPRPANPVRREPARRGGGLPHGDDQPAGVAAARAGRRRGRRAGERLLARRGGQRGRAEALGATGLIGKEPACRLTNRPSSCGTCASRSARAAGG